MPQVPSPGPVVLGYPRLVASTTLPSVWQTTEGNRRMAWKRFGRQQGVEEVAGGAQQRIGVGSGGGAKEGSALGCDSKAPLWRRRHAS